LADEPEHHEKLVVKEKCKLLKYPEITRFKEGRILFFKMSTV